MAQDPGRYREAEYADGCYYDLQNPWSADDAFFLALARREGGPVLDLGCGTGRLARAMAAAGLDVTAVDAEKAMLERARSLGQGGTVCYVEADARALHLGRCFRLAVMTAHAFQHLLTRDDQEAALAGIAAHLVPGGCFAFDLRNLAAQDFALPGRFRHWDSFTDGEGARIDVETAPHWQAATGVAHYFLRRRHAVTGAVRRSSVCLRYTESDELDGLLAAAGLIVEQRYGDWPSEPFQATSPEIITICRKA